VHQEVVVLVVVQATQEKNRRNQRKYRERQKVGLHGHAVFIGRLGKVLWQKEYGVRAVNMLLVAGKDHLIGEPDQGPERSCGDSGAPE
jgi:hypothetical protein